MATFGALIASGKVKTAYLNKKAVIVDIDKHIELIKDLDRENPSSRKFSRLESSAEASVLELKAVSKELSKHLIDANPDISSDDTYKADQKSERESIIAIFNAIEDYIKLLNEKGISYPPDVKPSVEHSNLAAIAFPLRHWSLLRGRLTQIFLAFWIIKVKIWNIW